MTWREQVGAECGQKVSQYNGLWRELSLGRARQGPGGQCKHSFICSFIHSGRQAGLYSEGNEAFVFYSPLPSPPHPSAPALPFSL